jgi:hypothetical protein
LHDSNGTLFASNDNWRSTQQAQILATGLQPSNDAEPAIVATLAPGAYTAIVAGKNNTTGTALVEAYYINADTAYFPPYFSTTEGFGVPAHGPLPIILPDGTLLSNGTDQLIVFLDFNATSANMQAVATAISNANASVVGEIAGIHELQIQMHDTSKASSLISTLGATAGVLSVNPNLFIQPDVCGNACSGNGISWTGWVAADDLADPPTAANDVVIGVIDCFDPAQSPAGPGSAKSHGEVVEAFLKDAAGGPLSSNVTRIASDICTQKDGHRVFDLLDRFIQANPGKKVVINASMGAGNNPDIAEAWYRLFTAVSQALTQQYGDRAILVKSSGNNGLSLPSDSRSVGCNFVPVGALDESSPTTATKAGFSNEGPVVPIFAPACGVTPDAGYSSETFCGTSFAAPQVAGQLAAIWAKNPSLTGCQLTDALSTLSAVNGFRRFDGKQLESKLTGNNAPMSVSVTQQIAGTDTYEVMVNWSYTFQPTLSAGNSSTVTPALLTGTYQPSAPPIIDPPGFTPNGFGAWATGHQASLTGIHYNGGDGVTDLDGKKILPGQSITGPVPVTVSGSTRLILDRFYSPGGVKTELRYLYLVIEGFDLTYSLHHSQSLGYGGGLFAVATINWPP